MEVDPNAQRHVQSQVMTDNVRMGKSFQKL